MGEINIDKYGAVFGEGVRNSGWEPQGLQQDQAAQLPIEKQPELASPIPPLVIEAPAEQPVLPEPTTAAELEPFVPAQPATYMVGPDGTVVTKGEADGTPLADLAAPKGTPQ